MNLAEVREELDAAGTQRDKLQAIIMLGDELEQAKREDFSSEDKVPGCASDAYLQVQVVDGKVQFKAWSASLIIKGYLAIITQELSHKTIAEIKAAKQALEAFAQETGVSTLNAAPTRTNSFMRIYTFIEEQL